MDFLAIYTGNDGIAARSIGRQSRKSQYAECQRGNGETKLVRHVELILLLRSVRYSPATVFVV
jgi:hypothetical protein